MQHDALRGAFLTESARYLRDVYLPRMEKALATLPPGDLAWKPHAESLSFETILRHLEGNVRQWILSGIGGRPDQRDRASEFSTTGGATGAELFARLRDTVLTAAGFLEALDRARLDDRFVIQGHDMTGMTAIYHVVEHFSWHTGQAVWIAKARAGEHHGIAFYDNTKVNAARNPARKP